MKPYNDQLYDLTRRDKYDGNDIFDIERTLKEMRATNKLQTAMKRKLASDIVSILKKDITEGIEMPFISDTGNLETLQETIGKFKPITKTETKYMKGKRLKLSDKLKLENRLFEDPYSNMADKIKKDAVKDIERFIKRKSADGVFDARVKEKAATGIQRFYTGNQLKKQRAQLRQDILNAPNIDLETDVPDVLRNYQNKITKAATNIQRIARGVKQRNETANILETKLKNDKMKPIVDQVIDNALIQNKVRTQAANRIQQMVKRDNQHQNF